MSENLLNGEEIWSSTLPLLKARVGQATFDAVLRGTAPSRFDGSTFVLNVPNDFVRRMLEERHRPLISACLQEVARQPVDLLMQVAEGVRPSLESLDRPAAPYAAPTGPPAHEIFETTPLNPRYTFDNFVVADCNRFAHAAAQQVCRNPGRSYNPLFIHSRAGLGKTHLMQAIGHAIREQHRNVEVVYVSAGSPSAVARRQPRRCPPPASRQGFRPARRAPVAAVANRVPPGVAVSSCPSGWVPRWRPPGRPVAPPRPALPTSQ